MNAQKALAKISSVWGRRWFWLSGIGLALVIAAVVVMVVLSAPPPIAVFEQSRFAISHARRAEAARYAPELLQSAERSWEQARLAWRRENTKWFFRRDFASAQNLALVARQQAQMAGARALTVRDSLQWVAAATIALVKQKIDAQKEQFRTLPVEEPQRQGFVAGELLILESELAFNRRDYLQAAVKSQAAASKVGGAVADVTKALQAYLRHIPQWRHWVEETVAWSEQQKATVLVVDKMARRCYVYVDGHQHGEFPIELGPRWLGHKKQKGDGATPEGRYRVTKKKGPGLTKYHKALEIDYPNEMDRQQFLVAQKKRELPARAHIGGLIEIHGHGGKGVNWTAGCVALNNKDMDRVFELAKVGTPVTIVGSLKTLILAEEDTLDLPNRSFNGAAESAKPSKNKSKK
jgi:hypothetical protein